MPTLTITDVPLGVLRRFKAACAARGELIKDVGRRLLLAYAENDSTLRDQLVEAIAILDKSRSNPEDNSQMLWNHHHFQLRAILLWLLEHRAQAAKENET